MRELKLLCAADLHLDSRFEALPEETAKKRREGQRTLLFKIAELAERHGAQAILLSGDVFESGAVSTDTQAAFIKAFGAVNMPVFVSPGNHDPYSSSSVWARMHLPENIYVFKSEKIECVGLDDLNLRIWGAGFENSFCRPVLENFNKPGKTDGVFDVMVLHGDVCAGKSDYNPITRRQLEDSGMDYVALGHIHTRSGLERAGETIFAYPGCTEGRGYDETGVKGAYLVTVSETGVKAELLPLGGVRYEIITVDVSGGDVLEAVKAATLELSDNDYCRIILKGECEELPDATALRKALAGRFAELQLRDETVEKRDVWAQTGHDSLAGVFLAKLRREYDAAVSEEERRLVELAAHYGLAAIESGCEK